MSNLFGPLESLAFGDRLISKRPILDEFNVSSTGDIRIYYDIYLDRLKSPGVYLYFVQYLSGEFYRESFKYSLDNPWKAQNIKAEIIHVMNITILNMQMVTFSTFTTFDPLELNTLRDILNRVVTLKPKIYSIIKEIKPDSFMME